MVLLGREVHLRLSFPDQSSAPGDPLPEYNLPPVVETSVGIQFDGLHGYTSLSAAQFWDRVRDGYPVLEEREPLDPTFETFGSRDGGGPNLRLELVTQAIQPRFFFITKDNSELIQLQRDRLFYNWRRVEDAENYPRYVHVRKRLEEHLEHLSRWAADSEIGEIVPTQCEALYVNRVPLEDASGNKCGLSFIFPWLKGLMGMTEDGVFRFRRRLNDDTGEPVARLTCDLQYGTDKDGARQANFFLTVRGRPADTSRKGCLDFIDAARDVIVRTFTETTSDDAHKLWERTR